MVLLPGSRCCFAAVCNHGDVGPRAQGSRGSTLLRESGLQKTAKLASSTSWGWPACRCPRLKTTWHLVDEMVGNVCSFNVVVS